ncbi:MAG: ankyrin repeat domain-containing protein [Burkholderiales bacterium]|nr:ankyrin repeat domain-containing protein [Burkholderiales bacterium]
MKKYKAFISYSHRDSKWGEWLHKSLETYRVPKTVVGSYGRDGKIAQRIGVFFRDREELPTSHNLGEAILNALKDSQYLIVICSPSSAQSMWVNQEIIEFKKMNGEDRIFALVVDGEPNATDRNSPDNEAFPSALRFQINPDGTLSDSRVEPIAADAKSSGDGKENAKLKLLAGLLGIGFDDLKQREKRRQKQRFVTASIVISMALMIFGALVTGLIDQSQKADTAKQAEQQQREVAQNLKEKWIQEGESPSPLIDAIVIGNISAAEKALNEGGDINELWGFDRQSPLIIASQVGHLPMVKWLLDKGASLDTIDRKGYSAIHYAAGHGQAELFDIFVEKGANIDQKAADASTWRPIDIAASSGHINVIQKLLSLGAPIELEENNGRTDEPTYTTPLGAAIWSGREDAVRALLEAGARVDIKDILGRTPFDVAIESGHDKSTELLAKASNIDEPEMLGRLIFAASSPINQQNFSRIDKLISKGANVNYIDPKRGGSVLASAIRAPDLANGELKAKFIEKLLISGADPDTQVIDEPAIFHQVKFGDVKILELLINAGADLSLKDRYGKSLLENAIEHKQVESAKLLADKLGIETSKIYAELLIRSINPIDQKSLGRIDELILKGADVNYVDQDFNGSILGSAIKAFDPTNGQLKVEVLKKLLNSGADPNGDFNNEPIIILGIHSGNVEILKLLIEAGADLNVRDSFSGRSLLEIAKQHNKTEAAELIKEATQ